MLLRTPCICSEKHSQGERKANAYVTEALSEHKDIAIISYSQHSAYRIEMTTSEYVLSNKIILRDAIG